MASASECALQIPKDLWDAVNTARPKCSFDAQGYCKNGKRCKLLHAGKDPNELHLLPFVSRYKVDGQERIEIRPPAEAMMKAYWVKELNMPCPVGQCRRVKDTPLLEFQILEGKMQQPLAQICHKASSDGKVHVDVRNKYDDKLKMYRDHPRTTKPVGATCGGSVKQPLYIMHGTKGPNALSILQDGHINHSEGIAGVGVYGFEVTLNEKGELYENGLKDAWDAGLNDAWDTGLKNAWKMGVSGGYTKGSAFLLRIKEACFIHGTQSFVLPPGTLSWKKQNSNYRVQFAAHQSVITYEAVIFHEDSLVEMLAGYVKNYSPELQKALADIRNFLKQPKSVQRKAPNFVTIRNPLVADGKHTQSKMPPRRLGNEAKEISKAKFWADPAGCVNEIVASAPSSSLQPPQHQFNVTGQWLSYLAWSQHTQHQPPPQCFMYSRQQQFLVCQQQNSLPPQQQPLGLHQPPHAPSLSQPVKPQQSQPRRSQPEQSLPEQSTYLPTATEQRERFAKLSERFEMKKSRETLLNDRSAEEQSISSVKELVEASGKEQKQPEIKSRSTSHKRRAKGSQEKSQRQLPRNRSDWMNHLRKPHEQQHQNSKNLRQNISQSHRGIKRPLQEIHPLRPVSELPILQNSQRHKPARSRSSSSGLTSKSPIRIQRPTKRQQVDEFRETRAGISPIPGRPGVWEN